jgi:beta-glucosidase
VNTNRIVHPGFWFGKTDKQDALKLAALGVGGFCVYGGTKESVAVLTRDLQGAAPHKLIFSADYEDGLGRWLEGTPLLPSNMSIGAAGKEDFAYKKGLLTALQARALGIEWILAPVADLADTPQNPIVNTRAFGADAELTAEMAKAFMRGLHNGACLNSLKHFPGHGSTAVDSHLKLPEVAKTFKQLDEADLVPYKKLLTKADSIMISHLLVKDWDADNPVSFSHKIITGYLKGVLHYKGVVVTDALMMGAVKGLNPVKAFKAGAEILLSPGKPFKVLEDLKAALAEEPALKSRAMDALSAQERMLAKLMSLTPQHYKEDIFGNDSLSRETAPEAVCAVGGEVLLKKGGVAHYLEPDIYPGTEYKANVFLDELKNNGIVVKPYKPGDKPDVLIAATLLSYGASRGYVNFNDVQKKLLNDAIAASNKSVIAGFGSPFVNRELRGLTLFLMAATRSPAFQHTVAQILLGKAKAKGKMPV